MRAGAPALLSVYAPTATAYQWRKDGIGIPGATQSWLDFAPASLADSGTYDVIVYGTGTAYSVSQSALLRVIPIGFILQIR